MISLIDELKKIWKSVETPFFIQGSSALHFSEVLDAGHVDLSGVKPGNVVAVVGNFDAISVNSILRLIDIGAFIVPLTEDTSLQHDTFFEAAHVDFVIRKGGISTRSQQVSNVLLDQLRSQAHAGLILFTSGTTGTPKAILHDLTVFLERYRTPRPRLRTLGFLLFDHIGGINTLLHTLFNRGVVIVPDSRSPSKVLEACELHEVEVLPTTPTFLRMMLLSGLIPSAVPDSLKVITYGTEKMDQSTLNEICKLLPNVDFRQTYGMSEIGILRVKSEARDSLFMRIGGEGVDLRVVEGVLHIKSQSRMVGYLNADSPFDTEGWYNTKDIVEQKGEFYSVVGRDSDQINFGGLKFMPSQVENVALEFPNVLLAKAVGRPNPFSGQHVELIVEAVDNSEVDIHGLKDFLAERLQRHMVPQRITFGPIAVGHRFKKS